MDFCESGFSFVASAATLRLSASACCSYCAKSVSRSSSGSAFLSESFADCPSLCSEALLHHQKLHRVHDLQPTGCMGKGTCFPHGADSTPDNVLISICRQPKLQGALLRPVHGSSWSHLRISMHPGQCSGVPYLSRTSINRGTQSKVHYGHFSNAFARRERSPRLSSFSLPRSCHVL